MPTARELLRFIEQHFNDVEIPAADRTVAVNHNSQEYTDADASLEKLETALREPNYFGTPEEKEQRQAEVSAARRLLKAARVRILALVELLKPLFTQYKTKLRDGIVALAVSGTLTALGLLFGKIFG